MGSKNLYNSRKAAIDFFEEFTARASEALAQIKAGKDSESLLNKIRQIVYSLYQSKEITKKVYINIIKSIKV